MHKRRPRTAGDCVRREVALANGHCMSLVAVFRRNEPPCFVLFDRSASGTANLFAGEMWRWLAPVEGSRETLQGFVPEEEETRTMQIIGSRLGDNVDDAGAGPAHLGCEFVGGDLKLCHSILWEVGQRSADDFVIVI